MLFHKSATMWSENLKFLLDDQRYFFEKTDTLTLWLVGLAGGSIVLIMSGLDKVLQILSPVYTGVVLILFVLAIIVGVFYRLIFLDFFEVEARNIYTHRFMIATELVSDKMEFQEGDTIEDVILYLKEIIGIDRSDLLSKYNAAETEDDKTQLFTSALEFYLKWADRRDNALEDWMKKVRSFHERLYGESNGKKYDPSKAIRKYKRLHRLVKIFSKAYIVFFLLAVGTFTFGFMRHLFFVSY
jgi:hypothetical protein